MTIGLQRRTLGSFLSYALDHGLWFAALPILVLLGAYWDARGLDAEADAWADRVRAATEARTSVPPSLGSPAGMLWLYAINIQASRDLQRHRLDRAEHAYRQVMSAAQAMEASPAQRGHAIAISCQQLGMVAQRRGDLDAAQDWYHRSLAVAEDRRIVANTCQLLSTVAQQRGDLDAAEEWHRKSRACNEERINRPGMAGSYHELGLEAQLRDDLDAAEHWYHRSLAISEEIHNRQNMARTCNQLGVVATLRDDLDAAEYWYRRSLALSEEIKDWATSKAIYHNLGNLALYRGDPGAAQDWYHRSLAISEERNDLPGMAVTCLQIAVFSAQRGHPAEALAWTVRCVSLFDEIPHPSTGIAPAVLVFLTGQLGMDSLDRAWQEATGGDLPTSVRDYVADRVQGEEGTQ
jgi:tetratricopeptide (TPR) repeat protein